MGSSGIPCSSLTQTVVEVTATSTASVIAKLGAETQYPAARSARASAAAPALVLSREDYQPLPLFFIIELRPNFIAANLGR